MQSPKTNNGPNEGSRILPPSHMTHTMVDDPPQQEQAAKEEEKTAIGGSEAHAAACSMNSVSHETGNLVQENSTTDLRENDVMLGRGKIAEIEDVCEYITIEWFRSNLLSPLVCIGTGPNEYVGNVRFRHLLRQVLKKASSTKDPTPALQNKLRLARQVVHTIKSRGGRFLERSVSSPDITAARTSFLPVYREVVDRVAVEKTKQSFRHQLRNIEQIHQGISPSGEPSSQIKLGPLGGILNDTATIDGSSLSPSLNQQHRLPSVGGNPLLNLQTLSGGAGQIFLAPPRGTTADFGGQTTPLSHRFPPSLAFLLEESRLASPSLSGLLHNTGSIEGGYESYIAAAVARAASSSEQHQRQQQAADHLARRDLSVRGVGSLTSSYNSSSSSLMSALRSYYPRSMLEAQGLPLIPQQQQAAISTPLMSPSSYSFATYLAARHLQQQNVRL
jgi:hypothetical protein